MMEWGNILKNIGTLGKIVGVGVDFLCRVTFTADLYKL